jgi:hypothetical protein
MLHYCVGELQVTLQANKRTMLRYTHPPLPLYHCLTRLKMQLQVLFLPPHR